MGPLIIILFLLLLYRTCRHYRARKASSTDLTRATVRPSVFPQAAATAAGLYGPRSIGLTSMENKFYHQAKSEAEHKMAMRPAGATGSLHHHRVSREMNQPTLHTPSTSKSTVISKLIVKCKISFYLLIYPNTYLPLSHSTFFFTFEFFF